MGPVEAEAESDIFPPGFWVIDPKAMGVEEPELLGSSDVLYIKFGGHVVGSSGGRGIFLGVAGIELLEDGVFTFTLALSVGLAVSVLSVLLEAK